MNKPLRLLIGGSPCQRWSISQHNNREVTASGEGWELFKNYLIAKEKFQPDYFLYENNKSASQAIKEQIALELGYQPQYINSALVSAQNRERFYVHNIPNVPYPEDRNISLINILEPDNEEKNYELKNFAKCIAQRGRYDENKKIYQKFEVRKDDKTNTLTTVQKDNFICKSIKIKGKIELYLSSTKKSNIVGLYEVKDGMINHNNDTYAIGLPDGIYEVRKLTPTEYERLQTLPDGYTDKGISNTQRYKCLGNGWTAEVIIHILSHINYPKDQPIEVLSMYDGIGTGRYCLEKLGYTNITYKAYEIDKYAIKVAVGNYPDIIECGDCFQVREKNWRY